MTMSPSGLVLPFLHIHKQTDPAGLWDLQHQPPRELHGPGGLPTWRAGAPEDPEGEGGHQAVPAGKRTSLFSTCVSHTNTKNKGAKHKVNKSKWMREPLTLIPNCLWGGNIQTLSGWLSSLLSLFFWRRKGEERRWGVLGFKTTHCCLTWTRTTEQTHSAAYIWL